MKPEPLKDNSLFEKNAGEKPIPLKDMMILAKYIEGISTVFFKEDIAAAVAWHDKKLIESAIDIGGQEWVNLDDALGLSCAAFADVIDG